MAAIPNTIRKIFWNSCGQRTSHDCRGNHERTWDRSDDDEAEIDYARAQWSIWACRGCEEVTFSAIWNTSDNPEPEETFYPKRAKNLAEGKMYWSIPLKIDPLYREVIDTFNHDSFILCAAGLRALLEAVCVDKNVATRKATLATRIDGLKSFVPETIVKNLHGFRFLGNRALHELERPTRKDLALALEVIEDILNIAYELDYKSANLYRRVAARKAPLPERTDEGEDPSEGSLPESKEPK